jgi:putative DNA primase/helicase
MARKQFPFATIAKQALLSSEILVSRWLPGGKTAGPEYQVTNPNRADNKVGSFSINLDTGAWADFATDDRGGDLISLYAYLEGIDQKEAAIDVADQIGYKLDEELTKDRAPAERQKPVIDPESVKDKKPKEPSPWRPVVPVPANAPPPHKAHPVRGLPQRTWCYRNAEGEVLGYIYRFATSDGGKETLPHTYCVNEKTGGYDWRWMQWEEPRPLYGLDRLAEHPDRWVLLVEGEKCADAPVEMLPRAVIVSWPGGGKAIDKVDWSPLAGRNIYAWADCDAQREKLTEVDKKAGKDPLSMPLLPEAKQPGMKAMLQIHAKLIALDPATKFKLVDIPAPGVKPEGWDVADAIDEGMSAEALSAFIMNTRPHLHLVEGGKAAGSEQPDTPNSATAGDEIRQPTWKDWLLEKRGELVPCLANVYDILANDEKWKGVLAFDEFAQRVVKLRKPPYYEKNGAVGEWDAQDDARTAMWVTRTYRLSISPALAGEAVEAVARTNAINPPRDWMKGLVWDKVKRVDTWMHDYMGVKVTPYTQRVARWFFMGMVKRVFEPGCQFDYCLVLEGPQGRKKSSALAIIGGEWYGDTDLDLHNKDSMSALRGKMLYEFSEMGSVAKAEATRQKSFLTRRIDEYRPVYGRREIRVPRSVIFSGTTNEWEWNKDPTGGRRFWPVEVTQLVDAEGLRAMREQLFAEAVVMVESGLRCYPTLEEQEKLFDPEQLKRQIQDPYLDALHDAVMNCTHDFSLYQAATEWLKLDAKTLANKSVQTSIGNVLRQLGCTKYEKKTSVSRYWYKPPSRNEATSDAQQGNPPEDDGDDDYGF